MKDFVTAAPHVSYIDLTQVKAPFFIIACDGVWDVFSDQEAGDYIYQEYKRIGCKPFQYASEMLVNAAIEKGSADNITAIVTFLHE